jgi:hypothetical protein
MCRRQRRHVERLADVARRFRAAAVLVQEGPAAGKIEQCRASKQRYGFFKPVTVECETRDAHVLYKGSLQTLTLYRVCLDAGLQHLVSHDFGGATDLVTCRRNGRLLTTQLFQPKLILI